MSHHRGDAVVPAVPLSRTLQPHLQDIKHPWGYLGDDGGMGWGK